MATIQEQLKQELFDAAQRFRDLELPNSFCNEMERLAQEVDQPCVVAIVGRVNAGKSTFINALLGQDLAKVGNTETTATINYFRYGNSNPEFPVRCYWRSGGWDDKDRAFLDSLQGNDEETLRRANDIKHLEYRLPTELLKQVTLVDTPGTMAVVDEHQNRTAKFMKLYQQLRERHDQDTQELGNTADAVVYLFGEVARANDQELLDEFRHTTRSKSRAALNAIGVMSKIDLQPEIMMRRNELANRIANQLKESLNTVIPVSAGLKNSLHRLQDGDQSILSRLIKIAREIPPSKLGKFLDSDSFFLNLPAPVSSEDRENLLDDLGDDVPWTVFTTIAQAASNPNLDQGEIIQHLEELAGFSKLNQTLEQHFFQRGEFLRSYRIVGDVLKLLDNFKYYHLDEFNQRWRENEAKLERFLGFIHHVNGNPIIAQELEEFITERLSHNRLGPQINLQSVLQELDRNFSRIFHDLEEYNADFEALCHMEENHTLFSSAELDELRPLFGLYGLETKTRLAPAGKISIEYVEERQLFWRNMSRTARENIRRDVAERATDRYGLVLDNLLD